MIAPSQALLAVVAMPNMSDQASQMGGLFWQQA
jgi:hypothetical protein